MVNFGNVVKAINFSDKVQNSNSELDLMYTQ